MGVLIGFVCGLREFRALAEINFDFVKFLSRCCCCYLWLSMQLAISAYYIVLLLLLLTIHLALLSVAFCR